MSVLELIRCPVRVGLRRPGMRECVGPWTEKQSTREREHYREAFECGSDHQLIDG